ncbi:unnamed protein product, partial [Allacma fusca]
AYFPFLLSTPALIYNYWKEPRDNRG